MRARLREEIVVTMSVEEARKLKALLPEWVEEVEDVAVVNALIAALDSVLGTPAVAAEVDHRAIADGGNDI